MIKREFLPYYLSRLVLSVLFAIVVLGFTWQAFALGGALFALFVWYLHSGWYRVQKESALFPLRRDAYGLEVQRKSLVAAIMAMAVGLLLSWLLLPFWGPIPNAVIMAFGIGVFFLTKWYFFMRA